LQDSLSETLKSPHGLNLSQSRNGAQDQLDSYNRNSQMYKSIVQIEDSLEQLDVDAILTDFADDAKSAVEIDSSRMDSFMESSSKLVGVISAFYENKIKILKSKMILEFDIKCQENFEDQKTFLQKELERRLADTRKIMEAEFEDKLLEVENERLNYKNEVDNEYT